MVGSAAVLSQRKPTSDRDRRQDNPVLMSNSSSALKDQPLKTGQRPIVNGERMISTNQLCSRFITSTRVEQLARSGLQGIDRGMYVDRPLTSLLSLHKTITGIGVGHVVQGVSSVYHILPVYNREDLHSDSGTLPKGEDTVKETRTLITRK
ncbi:hypothetical protein J6590_020126 [Homalodisca vitripennis]|nr:hypothetical protein J6590_020126 [Homalodisca vitripennis]